MPKQVDLKIQEVIKRNYNVVSIRLGIEGEPDFEAGQFLDACFSGEKQCRRYLSISSSPTEKGYIEFTKKLTGSDFSLMLESAKPGDIISVQYPFGKFTLSGSKSKVAFLSGGIGITPIRSMCKFAVDKNLGVDIALIYANRSVNDIIFKEDFDQMQKQYSLLKVANVLSEPASGFNCAVGRINAQIIKTEIPDYSLRKFYICGPPPMVIAMNKILSEELGLSKENIVVEQFQGY
jgi:glycine betaine catabolism B